jgi:hypothetical protein
VFGQPVPPADPNTASFQNPMEGVLAVGIAPDSPRLKELGVRYVLLVDSQQKPVDQTKLRLLSRAASGHFTIYERL